MPPTIADATNTEIKLKFLSNFLFGVTKSQHLHVELLLYILFYIVLVLNKMCTV
jgi:hypothetical protein